MIKVEQVKFAESVICDEQNTHMTHIHTGKRGQDHMDLSFDKGLLTIFNKKLDKKIYVGMANIVFFTEKKVEKDESKPKSNSTRARAS